MSHYSLFEAIDTQHQYLGDAFLLHQEALLVQKPQLALTIFNAYQQYQVAHLTFENEHLLPELEKIEDIRWPHTLYEHEHNKVEKMLAKSASELEEGALIIKEGAPSNTAYRRWVIELLDRQKQLKNVLEHHEQREEQGMLNELDNALSQETLSHLCEQLTAQTRSAREAIEALKPEWLKALG
ncbi:hemerythrin domain-containing protein [Litoribacillus peritrichatus]|uniref:Hemerythrin-like domain-containing protein n=1 Tax=Litoribacillus peritrichatus TaxID=718191 RepID=A0ABP7M077_9GAMM